MAAKDFRSRERKTMQAYLVEWECISCGHRHSFRHGLAEGDDWPNKFEDLECENPDCGHTQDVRFHACRVTKLEE
jgi:predicted RNA-binding Zn-ribbon protein involved in translation (DUF1610 family)